MKRSFLAVVAISFLFFLPFSVESLSSDVDDLERAITSRFDQLVTQIDNTNTATRLNLERQHVIQSLLALCLRQSACQPDRFTLDDIQGMSNFLGSDTDPDIRLNTLLIEVIARTKDEQRQAFLRQQQKRLLDDLRTFCNMNVVCDPDTLTTDQVLEYVSGWQPGKEPGISDDLVSLQVLNSGSGSVAIQTPGPQLPKPYWDCSEFENDQDNSIRYGWLYWRDVRVFINPDKAREKQGPLVYYWHGSNENWGQIYRVLGHSVIQEIVDQGGIVVAPHAAVLAALPWYIMNPLTADMQNDFWLADQIAACAEQLYDINERRIYSMGFSAGGIMSTAMGRLRSSYIAAIASYSGGQLPWLGVYPSQQPDSYYSAYITYGSYGEDNVPGVEFAITSGYLLEYLKWRGFHKVVVCQQQRGHVMPYATKQKGWDFIKAQTYRRLSPAETNSFQEADVTLNQPDNC